MIPRLLETERLRLAPLTADEAEELHAIWSEPEVRRYLWDDQGIPLEQTRAILERSAELFASDGVGLWSTRRQDLPALCGFGGFWYFREPPELELLLGLGTAWWKQGFATEAGRVLIRFGFTALDLDAVQGSDDAANLASIGLMQRLGMSFDRQAVVDRLDTVFYRIERAADGPSSRPRGHERS